MVTFLHEQQETNARRYLRFFICDIHGISMTRMSIDKYEIFWNVCMSQEMYPTFSQNSQTCFTQKLGLPNNYRS